MEKARETARRIKKTFVENMDLMSHYRRSHLAIRLFRATGINEHNHHIKTNFEAIKGNLLADLTNHDDSEHVVNRSEVFFQELNKNKNKKGAERQKVFAGKKANLFYFRMVELAHIWNEMGFIEKEKHENWINFLKNKDLKSMILDDEVFRHYSAQLVTFVYLFKFNNVADLEEDFKQKFIEVFMNDKELDEYEHKNKIYTLTHFIIGASNYYQQTVSAEKFAWILDYFKSNLDEIMKKDNADIIAEIGLCFRLCGITNGNEIEKIADYLIEEFDEEKGYIPRLDGSIERSEHANSVAYLFLAGFDKLHKGPYFK